jgi:hypothetical protein
VVRLETSTKFWSEALGEREREREKRKQVGRCMHRWEGGVGGGGGGSWVNGVRLSERDAAACGRVAGSCG